jgi:hypothetical protein
MDSTTTTRTMTPPELEAALQCYREMRARRYRLDRAAADIAEERSHLDQDIGDAEADLAEQLKARGPVTIDGREYRHAERDGCDVVEVRPAGGP